MIPRATVPSTRMRDIGIASGREPEVRRDEGARSVNLTFRGISDARSSVDRDTRIRIALAPAQAVRLWRLLGEHLTQAEKQNAETDEAH
jgi:hypothetical protein